LEYLIFHSFQSRRYLEWKGLSLGFRGMGFYWFRLGGRDIISRRLLPAHPLFFRRGWGNLTPINSKCQRTLFY